MRFQKYFNISNSIRKTTNLNCRKIVSLTISCWYILLLLLLLEVISVRFNKKWGSLPVTLMIFPKQKLMIKSILKQPLHKILTNNNILIPSVKTLRFFYRQTLQTFYQENLLITATVAHRLQLFNNLLFVTM